MAVRIRLKKMGRKHRPFFRVCAMDSRAPRDGRVIEQLGIYDTSVPDTDARAVLNADRIKYWLSVGAKPTPKVGTLIKKYGPEGTHLEAQAEALAKMSTRRASSIEAARDAASKVEMPKPEADKPAESEAAAEAPASDEAKADAPADEAKADAPAEEAKADAGEKKAEAKAEEPKADAPAEEPKAEEAKAEEAPAEEKAE